MEKFVLLYSGMGNMGNTPEEQQKMMDAWMGWFGSLGEAVVDIGSPFGPSSTIAGGGTSLGAGESSLTGYSIVTADSLDDAAKKAGGCPVLANGGKVEIYQAMPMG